MVAHKTILATVLAGTVATGAWAQDAPFRGTYAGTFDMGGERLEMRLVCISEMSCDLFVRTPTRPATGNTDIHFQDFVRLRADPLVGPSLQHLQERLNQRDFEPDLARLGDAIRPVIQDIPVPGPSDCIDLSPKRDSGYHALCKIHPKAWQTPGVLYMPVLLVDYKACERSLFCGRVIFPLERQATP